MASGAQQEKQSELKLEAILPDWCALTWQHATVCAAFVTLFLWLGYLPIPTSTTWHDVWQGQHVSTHQGSVEGSMRLPLADGMRHFELPQIGYWIVGKLNQHFGTEGLSLGFCCLQTFCAALWAWLLARVSRRWWTALIPPAAMLLPIFDIGMDTSIFGGICLASTLLILISQNYTGDTFTISVSHLSWSKWMSILITFLVWANVDHSVVFGWCILLCLVLGRAINQMRSSSGIFSDIELKSRSVLLQCAFAVSLLNPSGIGLWQSLLWFPDNPVLLSYGGWQPLVLSGMVGITVAATTAFWIYCSRFSKQIPAELWLIPALALGLVSLNQSLVSFWLLPIVWASVAMLDRSNIQPASKSKNVSSESAPLRFGFSLACLLVIWLGFVLSPFAHHVLGGEGRSEQQRLGKSNPTAALQFLAANSGPNSKQFLFCPRLWSHQCLLAVDHCEVFATPKRSRIPDQANVDFDIIYNGQNGWRKLLDRYVVDTILVDKSNQDRLIHNLRAKPGDWKRIYEDPVAIIWTKGIEK